MKITETTKSIINALCVICAIAAILVLLVDDNPAEPMTLRFFFVTKGLALLALAACVKTCSALEKAETAK